MRFASVLAVLLIGAALAHADSSRWKRDTDSNDDSLLDGSGSGASGEEASGEASGEDLRLGSGEEVVPVDALTLQQLETLNTFAQQVQAESQKLIHQANLVMTEVSSLSLNAQTLGGLANALNTNSQLVLNNARSSLNVTGSDTPNNQTCTASKTCYNDGGCGTGKCIGALAGTCNCNSCIYGWPCKEDGACGGFDGACNTVTSTCDCFAAYNKHNMTLTEALTSFCNVAKCTGTDNVNECHGLDCNYGFCVC